MTAKKTIKDEFVPLEENQIQIEFAYNAKFILPYEEGLKVLEAFRYAQGLNTPYNEPIEITGLKEYPKFGFVSIKEIKKVMLEQLITKD